MAEAGGGRKAIVTTTSMYVPAGARVSFVDDDEETMSVEDAVPCDQRSKGVVDSGGTGKKRARLKIPTNGRRTDGLGKNARTRQKRAKNDAERLKRERQGRRKRLPGSLKNPKTLSRRSQSIDKKLRGSLLVNKSKKSE